MNFFITWPFKLKYYFLDNNWGLQGKKCAACKICRVVEKFSELLFKINLTLITHTSFREWFLIWLQFRNKHRFNT